MEGMIVPRVQDFKCFYCFREIVFDDAGCKVSTQGFHDFSDTVSYAESFSRNPLEEAIRSPRIDVLSQAHTQAWAFTLDSTMTDVVTYFIIMIF